MSKICTTCAGVAPKLCSVCKERHPCPTCGSGRGYPFLWYLWHGAGVGTWLALAARCLADRSVAGALFCGAFAAAHVWLATWKRKGSER